jgi:GatB/GatE catalytic domain
VYARVRTRVSVRNVCVRDCVCVCGNACDWFLLCVCYVCVCVCTYISLLHVPDAACVDCDPPMMTNVMLDLLPHTWALLDHEVDRQKGLAARGECGRRETRSFDPSSRTTSHLRSKESEVDYRFASLSLPYTYTYTYTHSLSLSSPCSFTATRDLALALLAYARQSH